MPRLITVPPIAVGSGAVKFALTNESWSGAFSDRAYDSVALWCAFFDIQGDAVAQISIALAPPQGGGAPPEPFHDYDPVVLDADPIYRLYGCGLTRLEFGKKGNRREVDEYLNEPCPGSGSLLCAETISAGGSFQFAAHIWAYQ